ncbi:uncharacterized protein LAESUDRAFT_724860, partial [Laetiporus sulphureus 93-53]
MKEISSIGAPTALAGIAGGSESTTVRMSLKMKLCVYQVIGHKRSRLLKVLINVVEEHT